MPRFLSAHGYDPGPTQRPVLAGTLTGIIATVPATAILAAMGSLAAETEILDLSIGATAMAGCGAMALAGGLYGRLFQRTANDRRGGWLFGMAYGFLLWAAGGVLVLPLLSGGLAPAGPAAIGLFLSFLVWGTALGAAFPHLHRRLHISTDKADAVARARLGSTAAAAHDGHATSER
jgi:hypothetical protein